MDGCIKGACGTAEAMAWAVRCIGRGGIAATAISAVDIALWGLKPRLTPSWPHPTCSPQEDRYNEKSD